MASSILDRQDFDEWFQKNRMQPKYQSAAETRLPHEYWTLDLERIKVLLKTISNKITYDLATAPHDDHEIQHIYQTARDLHNVCRSKTFLVALTGQQAAGKSTLLNALLDCPSLCLADSDGGACTSAIVQYFYYCGSTEEAFVAEVKFLRAEKIEQIIEEHARDYYHFYHWDDEHHDSHSDEDSSYESRKQPREPDESDVQARDTAQEIFETLFGGKEPFADAWSAENFRNGAFQKECFRKHLEIMGKHDVGSDRTMSYYAPSPTELMKKIKCFLTRVPNQPCLWPLVDTIRYGLNREILKEGVELLDIPGWGDRNITKARHAEEIRDTVDFEIICIDTSRIKTENTAINNIRRALRARGAKKVLIAATKIDALTESDLGQMDGEASAFINRQLEWVETSINDATVNGDEDEERSLEKYRTYLGRERLCLKIADRRERIEQDFCGSFKDLIGDEALRMFHTAAPEYMKHISREKIAFQFQSNIPPELTGIPPLRRMIASFPAESNLRDLRKHAYSKVDNCIEKIDRVVRTDDRSEGFQTIAVDVQTLSEDLTSTLKEGLQSAFNAFSTIICNMNTPAMAVYRECIDNLVNDSWLKAYTYPTFNKIIKQKGCVLKGVSRAKGLKDGCNFNLDLALALEEIFKDWKHHQNLMNEHIKKEVTAFLKASFRRIMLTIENSKSDVSAIAIAKRKWSGYQSKLIREVGKLHKKLQEFQTQLLNLALMRDVDRSGPVPAVTDELFDLVFKAIPPKHLSGRRQVFTVPRYRFQKETLQRLFIEPNDHILDRVLEVFRIVAEKRTRTIFDEHIKSIEGILKGYVKTLQGLVPTRYESTPQGEFIRASLKTMLPTLRKQALELQTMISPAPEVVKPEEEESLSTTFDSSSPGKDFLRRIKAGSATATKLATNPKPVIATVQPHQLKTAPVVKPEPQSVEDDFVLEMQAVSKKRKLQ